jgi:hypothetical protein
MRTVLTLVLTATVIIASYGSAAAATLALHAEGVVGDTVRSDGERYIASASYGTGAIAVLDVRTNTRRAIPSPAGCGFADIHRATLMWSCFPVVPTGPSAAPSRGVTLDLATREIGALPAPSPSPGAGSETGTYAAIGERWAQAHFDGYHYSYSTYVDRVTGLQHQLAATRSSVIDLDLPSLTRTLCEGQRRPYVLDDDSGIGVELGDLATAGRWAAGTTYADVEDPMGRLELQRCGTKPRTLKICRTVLCTQPVITHRFVAWAENRDGKIREGRLVVRSLRTGRTRVTSMRARPLTPLLVGDRLYVLAGRRLLRAAL